MEGSTREVPGYSVVSVHPSSNGVNPSRLREDLLRSFAEQPPGVLCHLRGTSAGPAVLSMLAEVWEQVRTWPACPLVLCTAEPGAPEQLHALGMTRRGLVAASLEAADSALRRLPRPLRAAVTLTPTLTAPAEGRNFARNRLRSWGAVTHLDAVRLVVDELVANAVFHARSELELRVTLLEGQVGVAVADRSDRSPQPRPPSGVAEGGRGMILVDALADAWGVFPRANGGKVVWAAVRDPAAVRHVTLPPDADAVGPVRPGHGVRAAGAVDVVDVVDPVEGPPAAST